MAQKTVPRKALVELISAINQELKNLDEEMTRKESFERGKNVALIENRMDIAIDTAMHFTLGMSFKKIEAIKRKSGRKI